MPKYTPKQMAEYLRNCADGNCTDACPYVNVDPNCEEQLLRDAVEVIEACEEKN